MSQPQDPYQVPGPQGQPPAYGQQPNPNYANPAQPGGYQAPNYQAAAYGAPGYPMQNPTEKNTFNVWALVLSIFGLCCFPTAIAGLVMGIQGRKAAEQGRATNGGIATAAIVVGAIMCVLSVLGIIWQASALSAVTY